MKNNLVKSISRYIQHQSWPKELAQLFVSILKKLNSTKLWFYI